MPEADSTSELSVITRPTLTSRGTSSGPKHNQPPPGPPSNPSLLPWYHISTLSLLALGSFFGTLIRMGLTALFDNPGSAVFPVAWVQGTGGFLFGFFVHRRKEIERVWPAAYVGLRVGECASDRLSEELESPTNRFDCNPLSRLCWRHRHVCDLAIEQFHRFQQLGRQ